MQTGLIRRGARYSIRRRVPLDLVEHYGRAEIVRALGTADPKEARTLWPVVWAALTTEFDTARAALAASQAAPVAVAAIDPNAVAARLLVKLRARREAAAATGELPAFNQRMADSLFWEEAVLNGEEEPSSALATHEGIRNAIRAIPTGEGALMIPSVQKAAKADAPENTDADVSLDTLVDRWAKERRREGKSLDTHKLSSAVSLSLWALSPCRTSRSAMPWPSRTSC